MYFGNCTCTWICILESICDKGQHYIFAVVAAICSFKKIHVVIRELNLISIPKSIKYLMTYLKKKSRLRFTWNLSVDNCKEEWKINITSCRKKQQHNHEKGITSSLLYTRNLPRYLQLRIELEFVTVGLLLDAVNWHIRYI